MVINKDFFKNKVNILFILFIISYLVLMNYKIDFETGYDESRHSCQGHFFYDYFRTLLGGDIMSISEFLNQYQQKGYNIGWLSLYDPPAQAMFQGFTFLFNGGDSGFDVRVATEIICIFGAFILFALSKKILENDFAAFAVVAIYLLSPFSVEHFRSTLVDLSISFMIVGWIYYTFFYEGRKIIFKFPWFTIKLKSNILLGGLFLSLGSLMKYQGMVLIIPFMLIHLVYIYISYSKNIKETDCVNLSFFQKLKDSNFFDFLVDYIIQCIIFIILGFWWIKLALFDNGLFEKAIWAGTEVGRVYNLRFFFEFIIQTFTIFSYFSLFALIPILIWTVSLFKGKKEGFVLKYDYLLIFIFTIYFVATFVISNKQIRYMSHVLPILSIFMVWGMMYFSNFLSHKIKFKHFFFVIVVAILTFSVYVSIKDINHKYEWYGSRNSELIDFLKSKNDPKYVINVKAGGNVSGYYFSPDLFIYNTMLARKNNEPNPKKFGQWSETLYWDMVKRDIPGFLNNIIPVSSKVDVYVVLMKYDSSKDIMVKPLGDALLLKNFTMAELKYYKIYHKGPSSN